MSDKNWVKSDEWLFLKNQTAPKLHHINTLKLYGSNTQLLKILHPYLLHQNLP